VRNNICAGSGLLHSWYRDLDPLPHVAEHEFQSCHVPQFPFTKYIKWNISAKKGKRLQLKNHQNLIVLIIPIMINFTRCHSHWKFAVYHDLAVCGIQLMYIMYTRRSSYRIIKYMQKSVQNWECLQGNKTNTFVISGHVYLCVQLM
jgi:hypothetical protein